MPGSRDPETDSSDAVHCINSADQVEQRLFFALWEIESVGGKVDTGQHDFLVSGLHQTFYFLLPHHSGGGF